MRGDGPNGRGSDGASPLRRPRSLCLPAEVTPIAAIRLPTVAQADGVRSDSSPRERAETKLGARSRWSSPEVLLGIGVFVTASLSRTVWLSQTLFHPDQSTVLWMALDAVRNRSLPDHGLVSSYLAFQPPGLVWVTSPFVAIGGGRPEFVIVGFGLLNAAAIAFFAVSAARAWGLVAAAVTSAFTIVGPDAFMSSWIWHPSLYTGAMALLLGAAIRLRGGSRWWALAVAAIPGLYALVHYSGFVLYGPAAVAFGLSRQRVRDLLEPIAVALALTLLAWAPFLVFEWHRDWLDFQTIYDSTKATGGLSRGLVATIRDRLLEARFAINHLGEGVAINRVGQASRSVLLTPLITLLAFGAVAYAIIRRRFAYPVMLGVGVITSGLALQVVAHMGLRRTCSRCGYSRSTCSRAGSSLRNSVVCDPSPRDPVRRRRHHHRAREH